MDTEFWTYLASFQCTQPCSHAHVPSVMLIPIIMNSLSCLLRIYNWNGIISLHIYYILYLYYIHIQTSSFCNTYIYTNTHSRGSSTQPIWLDDVYCASACYSCLQSCQRCPSRMFHNCVHFEDITVECGTNQNCTDTLKILNNGHIGAICVVLLIKVSLLGGLLSQSVPVMHCCPLNWRCPL